MRVVKTAEFDQWRLTCYCTNPWCRVRLDVFQDDIRFGLYPSESNVDGEGFYFRCVKCKKPFLIHESMLFAPTVEAKMRHSTQ